uniref:CHASE domain-containing protein n=1 Tax=Alexandrium monilatum TaxID=311494 RepID=A0A7S4S494_9DINO
MMQSILETVTHRWKSVLTLVVLLAGMGVATYGVLKSDSDARESARADFHNEAFQVADKLRRQVETSVSSMYALASMVEVDGGRFLEEHFEPIASTILERYRGISNFDIAPFAVVKTKVPLAGNEGAIGHAMLSDHRRIEATLRTIREGKALLDGPLRLLQGGTAVIARYPVFTAFSPRLIPDIYSWWPDWSHGCCTASTPLPGYGAESLPGGLDANGNQTYFYGLVEFVSKVDKLTEDLQLDSVARRMSFQFRNKNPHPSMADTPVFLTSPDIGPGAVLERPVTIPISLPDIRIEWEFLAVPVGGWPGPNLLVVVLLGGIYGGLAVAGLVYLLVRRLLRMSASAKLLEASLQRQRREAVERACSAVAELAAPMALISAELFAELGRLASFEELRNAGKLIILDTVEQVQRFREQRWIVFFSHQWLGYSAPDANNVHYSTMRDALTAIMAALPLKGGCAADFRSAFVWVDYVSISQVNRSSQALCINSLPLFAAEADAFVMVVPEVRHSDTQLPCNLETYRQRGWCRAEILCKVCASGVAGMFVARGGGLQRLTVGRFKELSISVFEGTFTCCTLCHPKGMVCDKQKLASPILGMYISLTKDMETPEDGEAAGPPDGAKAEVFEYLTEQRELFFPHSMKYKTLREGEGQEVDQELFGDVVRSNSISSITEEMALSPRTSSRQPSDGAGPHSAAAPVDAGIPTVCPWQRAISNGSASPAESPRLQSL